MIVVTGANGQLGRSIVRALLSRIPAGQVVACVRDPARAADLASRGAVIRPADFATPDTLDRAFAGGDQLLIVSVDKLGEEALRLHRAAIDAAGRAGIRRILYTSHAGARPDSPFPPAEQHAGTEADLAASGTGFLSLRHGFYAESGLHLIGDALRTGDLRTPADGPVAWTARDDLAEADARILAGEGDWTGITPPLTAGAAVTMAEFAAIASEATGRAIRHTVMPDEAWRAMRIAAGMPPLYADMLLGTFRAARRGDFASADPALERLLGRPPRDLRAVIAAAAGSPDAH